MHLRFLQRIVTGLSLLLILLSACDPIQSKTSLTASQEQTIVDLVEKKLISASITGVSMDAIALHVTSISSEPLEILIPAGTYFLAENPSVQNMVARHAANASLDPGAILDIKVEAACASLHLAAPGPADTFAMVRASELPEMGKVIDQLNTTLVDYPVEQAAVWIVTDDASYDELGMLVGGSPFGQPLILEEDAVRAMMLVEQAGVDIRKYSIWRDRYALLIEVTEPDLVTWLGEELGAEDSSAPAGGFQATAQPTAAGSGKEISQFAYQAFGSSELSATDWSAMQATGAPNTTDCGDLPTAWSSEHSMPGATLKLFYEQAVIPTRIVIYESYNPGAIFMVEVLGFSGAPAVYQGDPKVIAECPYQMIIDIMDVKEPTAAITLTLDQENEAWNQIDAVELIGVLP
ncbi:MAG: hypothetical protein A2Y54_03045 [Chloroflexi bacterium RBG_16_51_16]|nr:MAG: hypothetical protein A2Y54_03045 [Chloroflexi bacterium RBG_16_51_16]